MRICFFTAGSEAWASSRMRAYWPAKYLPEATVLPLPEAAGMVAAGEPLPVADVYVFQKAIAESVAKAIDDQGHGDARKVWDVCDPTWWFDPARSEGALALVDGVTASTEALAADLVGWMPEEYRWMPVEVIGDCYEPGHFPLQAEHIGRSLRFVWFGIYANRVGLHAAQANLERLAANGYRVSLTVMDDGPEIELVFLTKVAFPIYHVRWSLERENQVLAAHDVALLPSYPGPWGEMKSNNRSLTAWASGLPVCSGLDYYHMERLREPSERQTFARLGADMLAPYAAGAMARVWETTLAGMTRRAGG